MAVTEAPLSSGDLTTPGTSFGTASTTPTTNRLQLLAFNVYATVAINTTPTVTGNGLTWVQVVAPVAYQAITSVEYETLFVYRARGTASAGAITIATGGATWQEVAYSLAEFAGIDTSGTNGSGAVAQTNSGFATGTSSDCPIDFAAATNAANAAYGAVAQTRGGNITMPGVNFFEIHDPAGGLGMHTEWVPSLSVSQITATWTGGSAAHGGIAVEIKAAAAAGTASQSAEDPIEFYLPYIAR